MASSASAPLDAAELSVALARRDVDCVLIGGTAMQVHGHVRTTQDVDVVAALTVANMRALAAALDELGARPKLAGDPTMPGTVDGKAQRSPITPRSRQRGTEHPRRAASANDMHAVA